jgi:hypothetical protein
LELFRGLAQRNKGRKTSYFDGSARHRISSDWALPAAPARAAATRGTTLYYGRAEEDDIRAANIAAGSSTPKRYLE